MVVPPSAHQRSRASTTPRTACALTALAVAIGQCIAGCARADSQRRAASAEPVAAHEEAVHVTHDGLTLSGTLVWPERAAATPPIPAVVLFHGSGPQARDLFTARWFASEGIAALAYDKRGVGESTGDFRTVPFTELCGDGLAAVEYLKTRVEVDARRIGVWGLSQGGWLGPLAASRSADVAWVIAVSGPAVSPGEQMIFYYAEELRADGLSERDVQEVSDLRRAIWTYAETGIGYTSARAALDAARARPWYARAKAQADDLFGPLLTPEERAKPGAVGYRWFRQEARYDPIPALRALHVPALFLFGDEDRLVPVPTSVAILQRVEAETRSKDFTIRVLPGADHGMRLRTTGQRDPDYLEAMRDWVTRAVKPPARR